MKKLDFAKKFWSEVSNISFHQKLRHVAHTLSKLQKLVPLRLATTYHNCLRDYSIVRIRTSRRLNDSSALCLKLLTKFSELSNANVYFLKPLLMLFCPLKILLNFCRFFLHYKISELGRIEKNFQGAKKHLTRFVSEN